MRNRDRIDDHILRGLPAYRDGDEIVVQRPDGTTRRYNEREYAEAAEGSGLLRRAWRWLRGRPESVLREVPEPARESAPESEVRGDVAEFAAAVA